MIALAITVIGSLAILVGGVVALKYLNIKRDAVKFNRTKMAAVRAAKKAASAPGDGSLAPPADRPAWLLDLLGNLGVDESILDSDDMPDELTQFMPMIQGFLDSGGLDKLKAASGAVDETGFI